MNYFGLGRYFHNVREFCKEINAATLTGAIDVVIVRQPDGSYLSSPFHVRFGKLGVLRAREKIVDITINGEEKGLHMKLGENGEGFFVVEADEDEDLPANLATSPIDTRGIELMEMNCNEPVEESSDCERVATPDLQTSLEEEDLNISGNEIDRDRMAEELIHHFEEEFATEGISEDQIEETSPEGEHSGIGLAGAEIAMERESEAFDAKKDTSGSSEEEKKRQSNSSRRRRRRKKATCKLPGKQLEKTEEIFEMDDVLGKDNRGTSEGPTSISSKAVEILAAENSTVPESRRMSEIHPFSDTDLSPVSTPIPSRAETPIKSDTEYELSEHRVEASRTGGDEATSVPIAGPSGSQLQWKWGELPARQTPGGSSNETHRNLSDAVDGGAKDQQNGGLNAGRSAPGESASSSSATVDVEEETEQASSSVFGSMFSFIRRSKNPATRVRAKAPIVERRLLTQSEARISKVPSVPVPPGDALSDEDHVAAQVLEPAPTSVAGDQPPVTAATLPLTSIYLDDLTDDIEPEIAALYLRTGRPSRNEQPGQTIPHYSALPNAASAREEDMDSGRGPSLSHSPNSNLGEDFLLSSDTEDGPGLIDYLRGDNPLKTHLKDLALSKCGGLNTEGGPKHEDFEEKRVTFDQLCEDSALFSSTDLVVRLNGRYMSLQTASCVVWSELLFQRPLPENALERHLYREAEAARKSSSWFSWRRTASTSVPPPPPPPASLQQKKSVPEGSFKFSSAEAMKFPDRDLPSNVSSAAVASATVGDNVAIVEEPEVFEDDDIDGEVAARKAAGKTAIDNHDGSAKAKVERSMSEPSPPGDQPGLRRANTAPRRAKSIRIGNVSHRKSLRLTSEQVEALNLRDGVNDCVFSVTTAYQGTSRCGCYIFLWNWTDKIVISDIDGTITKSDVLGHIMPMIGNSWAQAGVSQLFTKIARNSYKFLYLSARAIGQARTTREYLRSVKQDDHELPLGPLMLNPSSLLSAFHREVIIKKPEEFKIACMKDVLALFPAGVNPFYAGYGNRINDVWAYRAVGVPVSRIFTINHKGEVRHELTQTFQTSYCGLAYMVDMVFPPRPESSPEIEEVRGAAGASVISLKRKPDDVIHQAADQEMYSDFLYWRDPLPEPMELSGAVQKAEALSPGLDLVVAAGPDAVSNGSISLDGEAN